MLLPPGRTARVRAPATSANLGPGFDSFGLALSLSDEVVVTTAARGLTVDVRGEGAAAVPRDESHLVVRALRAGLAAHDVAAEGLILNCTNRIPHGRGLGSSSAAIVVGLLAAQALAGVATDAHALLPLASDLEGHPDNVAAALLGGFTIAWTEEGRASAVRLDPAPLWLVVFVPAAVLSTEVARGLLPAHVPHGDAARTAARAALLVTAITSRADLLLTATDDVLHQPYRAAAMPDTAALMQRLRAAGTAATVSGAGPSVLALCPSVRAAEQVAATSAPGFTAVPLRVAEGATVR